MTRVRGWWFEPSGGVLGFDDNRKPLKGCTHKVSGKELELCHFGLHASKSPLDALQYAQSNNIWRVELSGEILHGHDKSCATERTYLWRLDAEDTLRHFARLCALDVIHFWDAPDVVVRYLKTGDESLRAAARDDAWSAAWGTARDDAWSAARSAAWDAAWSAAWSAANAAARDAANVAARDAANVAACEKQSKRLHRMLTEAHRRGR